MPELFVSVVLIDWHSDGALSRRQPGAMRHGSGPMVGSRKVSQRTEVTSTPHAPVVPKCFKPWPPGSPLTTANVKWPAQLVPFWFQNWMPARLVVATDEYSSSSGAFNSLESMLPVASD